MAQITVNFDTKEKTIAVEKDGKKIKNVREIVFYVFDNTASAEIRTLESNDDDGTVLVTKIMANDSGEDNIVSYTEKYNSELITELSAKLFPRKNIKGV